MLTRVPKFKLNGNEYQLKPGDRIVMNRRHPRGEDAKYEAMFVTSDGEMLFFEAVGFKLPGQSDEEVYGRHLIPLVATSSDFYINEAILALMAGFPLKKIESEKVPNQSVYELQEKHESH